jgi:hypothetical protein
MYYFLILLGLGFILLGTYIRKKQVTDVPFRPVHDENEAVSKDNTQAPETYSMEELENRVELLEQLLFQSFVKQEENKSEEIVEHEEEKIIPPEEAPPVRQPMPDNIKAIIDYENQGLSIQEIANITRMNKGEVLLLKNLSKHYSE